jgi:hypothetical protein
MWKGTTPFTRITIRDMFWEFKKESKQGII